MPNDQHTKRHIRGTIGIQLDRTMFSASIGTNNVRHSLRVTRKRSNDGWDISCTCTGSTFNGKTDPVTIETVDDDGMVRRSSFKVAADRAWSHLDRAISSALIED